MGISSGCDARFGLMLCPLAGGDVVMEWKQGRLRLGCGIASYRNRDSENLDASKPNISSAILCIVKAGRLWQVVKMSGLYEMDYIEVANKMSLEVFEKSYLSG